MQDDYDAVCSFQEFMEIVCAVAAYRNPAPFIPLHKKLRTLLETKLVPPLRKRLKLGPMAGPSMFFKAAKARRPNAGAVSGDRAKRLQALMSGDDMRSFSEKRFGAPAMSSGANLAESVLSESSPPSGLRLPDTPLRRDDTAVGSPVEERAKQAPASAEPATAAPPPPPQPPESQVSSSLLDVGDGKRLRKRSMIKRPQSAAPK
eukprot:TRINITY_DN749_c0_g1_i10.p4 TRINITY_DN749_c0_g1~~TRINITY_DN749_c0_g1_i10.p4  ORF type:complete len:204 (+),score=45.87 TRINITY_DN749_c0_g1_i10:195-806(+)